MRIAYSRSYRRVAALAHLQYALDQLERRVMLSAWFDYDIVAKTGDSVSTGGTLSSINDVSINSRGRVAFTGKTSAGENIFSDDGSAAPTRLIGFNPPTSTRFYNSPQINDSGIVAAHDLFQPNPSSSTDVVRTWNSATQGSTVVIAGNTTSEPSPGFQLVTSPAIANDGQFAFIGTRDSERALYRNSSQLRGSNTLISPVQAGSAPIRPMISSGGVTVLRNGSGTSGQLLIDGVEKASTSFFANPSWTALGSMPGISDNGAVVVFSGDRGNGPGIFACIRATGGASYSDPVRIAGENGTTVTKPELGFTASAGRVGITSVDYDQRVGVASYPGGPLGPIGDSFVVTFVGTPSAASIDNPITHQPFFFTANKGVWSQRVDIKSVFGAPATTYDVLPASPLPVAQIGDTIGGVTITGVSLWDPITRADADWNTGVARATVAQADQYLAFRADTAGGGAAVIRAAKLDTDSDGLLDHWERPGGGIDADGDGTVDLSLADWGANVDHKDLFLEIDWQKNISRKVFTPPQAAIQFLVNEFAASPVTNPDGRPGITVHVDAGPNPSLTTNTGAGVLDGGDEVTETPGSATFIDVVYFSTPNPPNTNGLHPRAFADIKDHFFGSKDKRAREWAFKYVFVADTHTKYGNGSTGISEMILDGTDNDRDTQPDQTMPGNDLIISLNGLPGNPSTIKVPPTAPGLAEGPPIDAPNYFVWTSSLLHELGHTLGLMHNGVNSKTSSPPLAAVIANHDYHADSYSTSNKSVMNYAYSNSADSEGNIVRSYSSDDWANLKFNFSDYLAQMGTSIDSRYALGATAIDDEADRMTIEELTTIYGALEPLTPQIETATFDYQSPANAVVIDFNKNVSESLATADLVVQKIGGGTFAVQSFDVDFSNDTVCFILPALPNGNYRASLPANSVTDFDGHPLPADFSFDFFVLAGDANRDRAVGFADLVAVAQNYGKTKTTWVQGDFNGDGTVGFADLVAVAQNYGRSLPAPAAAMLAGAVGLPSAALPALPPISAGLLSPKPPIKPAAQTSTTARVAFLGKWRSRSRVFTQRARLNPFRQMATGAALPVRPALLVFSNTRFTRLRGQAVWDV